MSHCYFTSVRSLACLQVGFGACIIQQVNGECLAGCRDMVVVCSPSKTADVVHSVKTFSSVIDLTCVHPTLAASFRPVYASRSPFSIPVHAERKLSRVQWVVFYAGTMSRRNEIIRTKCDALSVPSSCWQYVDNHVTVIYTSKGWMPLPLLVCTHSNCSRMLTTGQC